jgi:hypothetical protein
MTKFDHGNEEIWIYKIHKLKQKEDFELKIPCKIAFNFGIWKSMLDNSLLKEIM